MSETTWHLTFEALPAVPGEPPVAVRIRRLLTFAGRVLRLKCVAVREPVPDPLAWAGWLWLPGAGAWVLACSHATEDGCRAILAERTVGRGGLVLPKGQVPEGGSPCPS